MSIDFSKLAQPCELHELTGCSICSGLDKQLTDDEDCTPHWDELPERIAPGVVRARYAGRCAECREPYPQGEPIRFSKTSNGWVGTECC